MKRMTLFFIANALLLLLFGCGGGVTGVSTTALNALIAEERSLSTEERTIATRICYAYQSKSTNFRTQTYLGKTFRFDVINKSCGAGTQSYFVNGVLTYDGASSLSLLTSETKPFVGLIQTNNSGFLSQLCNKIQTNQIISNTTTVGSSKVQIEFMKSGLDSYILRYFKSSNGKFVIESAETYQVRTQFDTQSGQILGMDESIKIQRLCSGSPNSDFSQTFKSVN